MMNQTLLEIKELMQRNQTHAYYINLPVIESP